MRIMAVDPGEARIGVALCDESATLASALTTLRAVGPRKDAQAIAALVREQGAGALVVGLPLRLDGTAGTQAEKVMALVARLRRLLRVPVVTWDERLTSVEAGERLAAARVSPRERRRRLDQAAATLILQEYLDARRTPAVAAGGPR